MSRGAAIMATMVAVAAILAIAFLMRVRAHGDRGGDIVTVQTAPASNGPPAPAPARPIEDAPASGDADLSTATTRRVLTALRLPTGATLQNVVTSTRGGGAICGRVAPAAAGRPRGFVFASVAGLAAIDDGTAGFGALHDQFCP